MSFGDKTEAVQTIRKDRVRKHSREQEVLFRSLIKVRDSSYSYLHSLLPRKRNHTMAQHWDISKSGCTRQGTFVLLLALCAILGQVPTALAKRECFADLNGPKDDPNNLYKCADNEKCCQDGGKPSCCREKDKGKAAMEQLQLWGTLAVLIVILAVVVWYCRHDGDCCGNKKDQKEGGCCGCCGGGKKKDPEIQEVVRADDDDDDDDDEEDKTPGPAVYDLPDKKKHPPPSKKQIPEEYRDMDVEYAS